MKGISSQVLSQTVRELQVVSIYVRACRMLHCLTWWTNRQENKLSGSHLLWKLSRNEHKVGHMCKQQRTRNKTDIDSELEHNGRNMSNYWVSQLSIIGKKVSVLYAQTIYINPGEVPFSLVFGTNSEVLKTF